MQNVLSDFEEAFQGQQLNYFVVLEYFVLPDYESCLRKEETIPNAPKYFLPTTIGHTQTGTKISQT